MNCAEPNAELKIRQRSAASTGGDRLFGFQKERNAPTRQDYATRADLCRIFNDEMKCLYWLAFLLTADHAKAEQCFVASIGDAVEGNPVFKQWAHGWARQVIIKNAIRIISPASQADCKLDTLDEKGDESDDGLPLSEITDLAPLERFVFVITVLERKSDRECAVLLVCPVEVVREARARGLHRMAGTSMAAEPKSKEQDSMLSSQLVAVGQSQRGEASGFSRQEPYLPSDLVLPRARNTRAK